MATARQLRDAGVYVPANVPDHEEADAIFFRDRSMMRPAVEEVAQRTAELLRPMIVAEVRLAMREQSQASAPTPEVLTLAEAVAYTKRPSAWAFYQWARRWRVKSKTRGRYSRQDLDRALERESGLTHMPATLRRHQEELKTRRLAA